MYHVLTMKRKLTGAEFKRFYDDPIVWGVEDSRTRSDATYVDDLLITIDGIETEDFEPERISDGAEVEILSGYLVHPQKGVPEDFAAAAVWWKRRSSMVLVVAEIDRSKLDALLAAIKGAGGKVLS